MHIGLIGASGRLGSLVKTIFIEQNIDVIEITRESLIEPANFKSVLLKMNNDMVILDLSLPSGTLSLLNILKNLDNFTLERIRGVVIGTTGHDANNNSLIHQLSHKLPICVVSNFSKGVYLFEEILNAKTTHGHTVFELARNLGFDLALSETHHTKKIDAPSGTAMTLAEAGAIPKAKICSLRVGKIVGEHTIVMSKESETFELKHIAHHRKLFAEGAVDLCKNIFSQRPKPGLLEKGKFF